MELCRETVMWDDAIEINPVEIQIYLSLFFVHENANTANWQRARRRGHVHRHATSHLSFTALLPKRLCHALPAHTHEQLE